MSLFIRIRKDLKLLHFDRLIPLNRRFISSNALFVENKCHQCLTLRKTVAVNQRVTSGYFTRLQYYSSNSNLKFKGFRLPRTPEDIIKKRKAGRKASAIHFSNSNIDSFGSSSLAQSHCDPVYRSRSTSLAYNEHTDDLISRSNSSSNPVKNAQSWTSNLKSFKNQLQFASTEKYLHNDSDIPLRNKHHAKSTHKQNSKKFKKNLENTYKNSRENSVRPGRLNKFDKNDKGLYDLESKFEKAYKRPFVQKGVDKSYGVEIPEISDDSFQVINEKDRKLNKRRQLLYGIRVSSEKPIKSKKLAVEVDKNEDAPRNTEHVKYMEPLKKLSAARLLKLEEEFNQNLLSFVEAWIFSGHLHNAHFTLKYYLYSDLSPEENYYRTNKIKDVNIYNALLHGWAKMRNLAKMQEIFSFMKESDVRPTLQSYAAVLECMGKSNSGRPEIANRLLSDIQMNGFDVKDIFNKCLFVRDERFYVKKALKSIDPDYTPYPVPETEPYIGPLIETLNEPPSPEEIVDKNPYHDVITVSEIQKKIPEQLEREKQYFVNVKSVQPSKPLNEETLFMREGIKDLTKVWKKNLTETFKKKVRELEKDEKPTMTVVPYLKLFKPLVYVDIMLFEVEKLASESEYYSPKKQALFNRFGYHVFNRYKNSDKQKNGVTATMHKLYKAYAEVYTSEHPELLNHRVAWQHICNQDQIGSSMNIPEKKWSNYVKQSIGKCLFDVVINALQVDSRMFDNDSEEKLVPAFYSIYRNRGYQLYEEVKPHPVVSKLFKNANIDEIPFEVSELPMVVPPIPWYSVHHGGYFTNLNDFVRYVDGYKNQEEVLDKIETKEIQAVLDSLNILGACPWIVNKSILDLIIDVFNNKGDKDLEIPQPPSEAPPLPKSVKNMNQKERYNIMKEKMKIKQQRSEMYSLWCSELYRLSIANQFRDKIFWFPHNIDFRGRTYPCPTHFNHLGSDVTRSLLLFAKGKPLGEYGLNWLKIHLVNLTGFKKRSSNSERLEFADEIMDEILDSADNPMTGRKWWQKSDEPWQTLACCMEIAKATRSPNPKEYVCHLPTHQDGSCNGLQHYAALGRDQAGAESVNLCQFEKPQDVYSDVAELVEKERIKDALNGDEIAKILEGFVARKVIKQTVMTTVYGVTRYGARKQIMGQLKDIDNFPEEHVFKACHYLTDKTFYCLQEMFSSTKEIQDWFTICAELISKVSKQPVGWVTPLGLPVIQPYQKFQQNSKKQQDNQEGIKNKSFNVKPDVLKQKNAFPPNYIHSLDSVHMMLTSLFCLRAGITFISVHDCFWTHPCDIDIMNKVCREQFVALHSQPLLEELSKYFIQEYSFNLKEGERLEENKIFLNNVLERVPKRGNFDISNVLKSTYFFS